MFELTSYLGLFLAAFGAATLLPMQSEAVLVGMLLSDRYVISTLLTVAIVGNVLGSVLNWALVIVTELGTHHWRPSDSRRRCHARALLAFPADRLPGQRHALSGAGRRGAGVDMTAAHGDPSAPVGRP